MTDREGGSGGYWILDTGILGNLGNGMPASVKMQFFGSRSRTRIGNHAKKRGRAPRKTAEEKEA